jgi:hypothetical protein
VLNPVRLSIAGASVYSLYAYASMPVWNSEPTVVGPLVRIVVFSSWLGLARILSQAQESFDLHRGFIGAAVPFVLIISGTVLLTLSVGVPYPVYVVFGLCSVAAYAFICGMFAAIPKSVVGALLMGAVVFTVQLVVDWFLVGVRAYGPLVNLIH